MQSVQVSPPILPQSSDAPDEALVARVLGGQPQWFAVLMRRYNGRLFRVARSITRDDHEAEDAVQQAYLQAYRDLGQFRGDARLATWLTTIVLREAMRRNRSRQARDRLHERHGELALRDDTDTPEDRALRQQLRRTLEAVIDALPEHYRTVFVLRDIEELSSAEVARTLDITEETVRVRLHRARASLRTRLDRRLGIPWSQLFEFGGIRCDRMVESVWHRITQAPPLPPGPLP